MITSCLHNPTNFFSSSSINYTTIQTLIFDYNLILCLNINENVLLCNCILLFLYVNQLSLVRRTKFIIIAKVAGMQILDQYIEYNVLLDLNRIPVSIKVYLINELQFDLIINMNVLNKNNIDLLLSR